jgi:anti-sigma factor RsiW
VVADADELTCQQLVEIVTEYLEGTLPASDRERFEAHIHDCKGCARYLQQMRTTIRLTGSLTEDGIEPEARDRLLQTFRHWKAR